MMGRSLRKVSGSVDKSVASFLNPIQALTGIELIETGYAPRGVAMLLGRRDTRIRYSYWRSKPLFKPELELIGKIDFNEGTMELLNGADIQQIRADESTMAKLKNFFDTEATDVQGNDTELPEEPHASQRATPDSQKETE